MPAPRARSLRIVSRPPTANRDDAPFSSEAPVRQRVALDVTVFPGLLDALRSAIRVACGARAEILGVRYLRSGDVVRVRFALDRASIASAICCILRALPSGEIGCISPL